MPFKRKPIEDDLFFSEGRFKQNFRYLIKVADSNVCEFCNVLGVSRKAITHYDDSGTVNIPKFLGYSVGLYRIACDHGRLYELNAAYRQAVGYSLEELMHTPL